MKPTIHLACATDTDYLPHAATLLASLAAHHTSTTLAVNLLHTPTTPVRKLEALAKWWAEQGQSLRLYCLDESRFAGLRTTNIYPPVIWGRIFLPEILANLNRVLYLDSDIVALGSLQKLWATKLGNNYLGAVTNPFGSDARVPHLPLHIGLPDMASYFNSGVLIMNLARMRKDKVSDRILAYSIAHHDELIYPDQDALNIVLAKRWLRLHPRWNVQQSILQFEDLNCVYDPIEFHEARITPSLIHFEGPPFMKPWNAHCTHPYAGLYRRHRRKTPWPRYIPDGILQKWLMPFLSVRIRAKLRAFGIRFLSSRHSNVRRK